MSSIAIDLSRRITAAERAAEAAQAQKAAVTSAIDAHVEATAQARGYNGAEALASYTASTVAAWAAEAQAFVSWRDSVWQTAIAMLAAVEAGERAAPTGDEAVDEMPAIAWP